MEIEKVLGLRIEQIAWMKQYFEEHALPMEPPREFIDEKLRECLSKQECAEEEIDKNNSDYYPGY